MSNNLSDYNYEQYSDQQLEELLTREDDARKRQEIKSILTGRRREFYKKKQPIVAKEGSGSKIHDWLITIGIIIIAFFILDCIANL
jgi:hypothetical protein